jgi:hypothetical protein
VPPGAWPGGRGRLVRRPPGHPAAARARDPGPDASGKEARVPVSPQPRAPVARATHGHARPGIAWDARCKWIRAEHRLPNAREDLERLWKERLASDPGPGDGAGAAAGARVADPADALVYEDE